MKTKNNVQKATTKLLTLGLIMVLSISVYAHGIKKPVSKAEKSEKSTTEVLDNGVGSNTLSGNMDVFASFLVLDTEEAMELEDWMTDEKNFDVYSTYHLVEQEEALEVEDWMTDESTFCQIFSEFETETESNMELEDWMTSEAAWNP